MESSVELPVSSPRVRAVRWTSDELYSGVKTQYAFGRVERGLSSFWGGGRAWDASPGCITVKQPGDVHRDIERAGPMTWTVITLPASEIERVRDDGRHIGSLALLEATDARSAPFHRLQDAVCNGADRLSLEVALTEAVNAFVVLRAKPDHTRPVRRAMEYLRAHITESFTLEDLAEHSGLDKFHLCRSFRAQIGMPPHAYLTQLRIMRAKELLRRGVRASEVAPLVGLYDQAQLTRHFRRIVGTTPGRYGKMRPSPSVTT